MSETKWLLQGEAKRGLHLDVVEQGQSVLTIDAKGGQTLATVTELSADLVKQALIHRRHATSLTVEHHHIQEIPVLYIYPVTSSSLPLVILVHGYTGHKGTALREGIRLAEAGFFTVLPDARLHGERRVHDFEQRFRPEQFIETFFHVVKGTVEDVSVLMDAMSYDKRIEPQRIGMAGISMGGFITFMAATLEPRLQAAAPLIGSPDWSALQDVFQGPPPPRHVVDEIVRFDPIRHLHKFPPTALLVQNGGADGVVPPTGTRNLHGKLPDLYQEQGLKNRYKYMEYPDIAHEVTDAMLDQTIAWFNAHL